MIRSAAALLAVLFNSAVTTESVDVAGRGPVDLAAFACTDTPRSTVVARVCYNEEQGHLLVSVRGIYEEYCRVPVAAFQSLITAPSMGKFFRDQFTEQPTLFRCASSG
jgi:hypothetical protein